MNRSVPPRYRTFLYIVLFPTVIGAFSPDSIFEPLMRNFDFLPDYYLRFNISAFALHRDEFLKRQYLAESRSDLEFRFFSFKDIVSSVWDVDFRFGLGEIPDNVVFTVLNVRFGIDPKIEVKLPRVLLSTGLSHFCCHEVDRKYFPLIYNNLLHIEAFSYNYRINEYFKTINNNSDFVHRNRIAWKVKAGYYLKEFFGLVGTNKLNGNSPFVSEWSSNVRYAFYKRKSWLFSATGETAFGLFDTNDGYHVKNDTRIYWKESFGIEAFFTRGTRGVNFYLNYHLDDLPASPNDPDFTMGNSRLSKHGLAEIGVLFFN